MYSINVAKDFSEYPGLRHYSISDNSGEDFYHQILNEKFHNAFINEKTLVINLDATSGFAPSFLDETFGNLIFDFGLENVKKHIEIISTEETYWNEMIFNDTFIVWEKRRIEKQVPKVTRKHKPWYRIINNEIFKKQWEEPATV